MDFMKWINSLDELLYEVMSWLLFFPLTLWRSIIHPFAMMDYADDQLALPDDAQYGAALSPPLFLAIALLMAHAVSLALGQVDAIVADRHGLAGLVNDDASALVLRLVVFASFSLFTATRMVRRRGLPIDRNALRAPFYAQCYPTGVFALGIGIGISLARTTIPAAYMGGIGLVVASIVYYVIIETRWFAMKLETGYISAIGAVAITLFEAFTLFLIVGFLFTR
ncbi:hypothetical protein D0Z70_19895 [Sphingobium terrigena]|uniref:Permease n=1 Tax=Sphingobium terrigena TaxID=2304063 RepID=A0A418YMU3_9SPHN|nr:hypothetical protein [Sphingobium terrigena]RJG52473.1 hypothetical protein D0Z70_19895 [Sphingobium terrigena]